jgi:hypothetical protein
VITSKKAKRVGNVARIGKARITYRYFQEKPEKQKKPVGRSRRRGEGYVRIGLK